jgi:hypothetical protein
MLRSLFHDHLQELSFVLSAFTTSQLPASSFVFFGYVAVCHLFVCVSGVAVCGMSGRALHCVLCVKGISVLCIVCEEYLSTVYCV